MPCFDVNTEQWTLALVIVVQRMTVWQCDSRRWQQFLCSNHCNSVCRLPGDISSCALRGCSWFSENTNNTAKERTLLPPPVSATLMLAENISSQDPEEYSSNDIDMTWLTILLSLFWDEQFSQYLTIWLWLSKLLGEVSALWFF